MQYKVVIGIRKKLGKVTLTYKNIDLLTFWYTGGNLNGDGTDLIILKNLFRVTNKPEAQNYFLRQGKAVLSTARRQPLGSAIAEATDMFVWNMPDPIDQYQNLGGTLVNKIGASPVDVFGEIIYPRFLTVLGN
jgi:hypothetical protein